MTAIESAHCLLYSPIMQNNTVQNIDLDQLATVVGGVRHEEGKLLIGERACRANGGEVTPYKKYALCDGSKNGRYDGHIVAYR